MGIICPFLPARSSPALVDVPKVDGAFNSFDSTLTVKGKVLPAKTSILKTVNNNAKIGFYCRI